MKRSLLLIPLALGVLTACGPEDPESGYVMRKAYDDPDRWSESVEDYQYGCQYEYGYDPASGKYGFANICKNRMVGSHIEQRYDGPHWKLRIKDDADAKHVEWVEVTEQEYTSHEVGSHWPDLR